PRPNPSIACVRPARRLIPRSISTPRSNDSSNGGCCRHRGRRRLAQGDDGMNTSPVFVAIFEDGEVARMTTFQKTKALDLDRGVRLARAAYESHAGQKSPPITEPHSERDGEGIHSHGPQQLHR